MRNIAGVRLHCRCRGKHRSFALSLEDVRFITASSKARQRILPEGRQIHFRLWAPRIRQCPGRDGNVRKLRSGRDALVFELAGISNQSKRYFVFISLVDWDGSNGDALQVLFHTDGTDQSSKWLVQTLWPLGNTFFMPPTTAGAAAGRFPPDAAAPAPASGQDLENVLKTGYFYHYVITWRDGYQALYLNGKLMAEARQPALRLRTLGRTFTLGWNRKAAKIFWDPGCEDKAEPLAAREWQSLIDDVTVLRASFFPTKSRIHQYGALDYARRAKPRALAIRTSFTRRRSVLGVADPRRATSRKSSLSSRCRRRPRHRQEFSLRRKKCESIRS